MQEGEYFKENKGKPSIADATYIAFWIIAICYNLSSNNWGQSWVIAAIMFPVIVSITNFFEKNIMKLKWLLCLVCKSKTRFQLWNDT